MAVDSIIQGVTDFFMECPLLKDGAFHVNALGSEPINYSIDVDVSDPILETYTNGDSYRQYLFAFSSREFYSLDRLQNIQNSAFFEKVSDWVERRSLEGKLPEMPDDCSAQTITALSPGYLYSNTLQDARYMIQFQLTYIKTLHREV